MQNHNIPNSFYRVSVKALIFDDETKKKFAVILEDSGWWEIPGGGLDYGESPEDSLKRELKEEMGLIATEISQKPSYYLIGKNMSDNWALALVYEVKIKDFNFTPTSECLEIRFISPEEALRINAWRTVRELADLLANQ